MRDDKGIEKKFERKLKLRAVLSTAIIACGFASVAIIIYSMTAGLLSSDSFLPGYYTGMGGGLIGAGAVTLVQSIILLRNDEKRRKRRMEEYDERNLYLRSCTMTYSGYIMVGVLYVGIIAAGFYSEMASMILLAILCIYLVVIFGVHILLRKLF